MTTQPPLAAQRRAFTLTELLIVITIIAILASLVTAAAVNAMRKAKQTRISMEISEISKEIENKKNDWGAYPPNAMNVDVTGNPNATFASLVNNDFKRMFKKAFPRNQEPPGLIAALTGFNGGTVPNELPGGMNAAEAVYFWLGGFSSDSKYPISGSGGPSFLVADGEVLEDRNGPDLFDLTRLGPRDDNGQFHDVNDTGGSGSTGVGRYIIYVDPVTGEDRRINFWTYRAGSSENSVAYVDASRYTPAEYDADFTGILAAKLFGVKKVREGVAPANARYRDLTFVNDGKFQVLHSGLDDAWGDWTPMAMPTNFQPDNTISGSPSLIYPAGPFIGDPADTLTNFTSGTLEDAQE